MLHELPETTVLSFFIKPRLKFNIQWMLFGTYFRYLDCAIILTYNNHRILISIVSVDTINPRSANGVVRCSMELSDKGANAKVYLSK